MKIKIYPKMYKTETKFEKTKWNSVSVKKFNSISFAETKKGGKTRFPPPNFRPETNIFFDSIPRKYRNGNSVITRIYFSSNLQFWINSLKTTQRKYRLKLQQGQSHKRGRIIKETFAFPK